MNEPRPSTPQRSSRVLPIVCRGKSGALSRTPAAYVCVRLASRVAAIAVFMTSLIQGALGTAIVGSATP